MQKMRAVVAENNVYRWAGKIISALLKFEFATSSESNVTDWKKVSISWSTPSIAKAGATGLEAAGQRGIATVNGTESIVQTG